MAYNERDRHVRRGPEDYASAMLSLLPQGQAWPRDPESTLVRTIQGLAYYYGFVDARAADLLERESDPRQTIELLPDWERAWGLPDPCLAEPLTVGDRQLALVLKMTMLGGQSRAFFTTLAAALGYEIFIREYAPWMFGISECGETDDGTGYWRWEIGPPEMRFYWTVSVNSVRHTWWQYGFAELGVDPHLRIALASDLECLFRRYKPAHTEVIFDYSEIGWTRHLPPTAALIFSSAPPRLASTVPIASAALALLGGAPVVTNMAHGSFFPASAGLKFTSGAPPRLGAIVPGTASVRFASDAPTVTTGAKLQPATASIVFAGAAPKVAQNRTITVGTASLVFAGAAPDARLSSFLYLDGSYLLMQDGSRLNLL